MEHPILGPLLWLPRGQTPKGIKIRISRTRDQSASFLVLDVEASISLRTIHNGKVCRPCLLRKRSRETERLVLIAIWCGNRDPELCRVDAIKVEKVQKGSNLITDGTTPKDDHLIKEKEVECPTSVSQLGLTEPSEHTSESLWHALDPKDQVVKVGLEVDVGYSLQSSAYTQ